jgi:RNA polymerase sigma factor (sigma-70 family)
VSLDSLGSEAERSFPEVFTLFFKEHKGPVFRALLAATGSRDHSEDATAEAFTRAYEHWLDVANHPNPRAWLVTVALNYSRSSRRKWEARLASNEPSSISPTKEASIDVDLINAIRRLPSRQREVIALRYLCDLTIADTAEALDIAEGTVTNLLYRARRSLHSMLDEAHDQERQSE